jgi:hypothetical protein
VLLTRELDPLCNRYATNNRKFVPSPFVAVIPGAASKRTSIGKMIRNSRYARNDGCFFSALKKPAGHGTVRVGADCRTGNFVFGSDLGRNEKLYLAGTKVTTRPDGFVVICDGTKLVPA